LKGITNNFPELKYAGTYKAFRDKRVLAYQPGLGVTTVELLPSHYHLDEFHLQQMGLSNYWGYNTYSQCAGEPSDADN
ncbi:glycogen debranching protein GlgX, partial [Neisseria sp. P0005.S008]